MTAAAPRPVPRLLRTAWRTKAPLFAGLLLVAIIGLAVFAPAIAPTALGEIDLLQRMQPPVLFGGSWSHPLGTDALGQDELTLLVHGARISVSTGLIVILVAGSFGTLLGLVGGYFRDWRETAVMRLVDVSIAFPGLLLALTVLTMVGAGQRTLIVILAALSWMVFARVTHDIVLSLRESAFVKAAETVGCSRTRVIVRHLLPNLASALLTVATLEFATVVLAEASLSYLGFGIQPPASSWGLMVANGQQYMSEAWWLIAVPGVAIAITVLSLNMLAGWLRVAADPRQRDKQVGNIRRARRSVLATTGGQHADGPVVRVEDRITDADPLLAVQGLEVDFGTPAGHPVHAVRGVSFVVHRGETLALVGESGSGKSVTALALQGLVPAPGRVVRGKIVWRLPPRAGRDSVRRDRVVGEHLTMVFQDPLASLNPLMPVGRQITEVLRRQGVGRRDRRLRALELLDLVGISDAKRRLQQYPYELSGGMAQRVMIATALAPRPDLIVADEPTTALDVTIQAQILELLREIQRELGLALLLISHDLGVVAGMCDRVAVMYAGRIVEAGTAEEIFSRPRHPYTGALIGCTPRLDRPRGGRMLSIAGTAPSGATGVAGCAFAPRCLRASASCARQPEITFDGQVRYECWHPLPAAIDEARGA